MAAVPLVLSAPAVGDLGALDRVLFECFAQVRGALLERRPVVVVVADRDLLGHGSPLAAALAGALVGLVRALGTEGRREGWQINGLAVGEDDPALREEWVRRLADPQGLTGELVRLGDLHLGRVPL